MQRSHLNNGREIMYKGIKSGFKGIRDGYDDKPWDDSDGTFTDNKPFLGKTNWGMMGQDGGGFDKI